MQQWTVREIGLCALMVLTAVGANLTLLNRFGLADWQGKLLAVAYTALMLAFYYGYREFAEFLPAWAPRWLRRGLLALLLAGWAVILWGLAGPRA